jgi:hypothetical protein
MHKKFAYIVTVENRDRVTNGAAHYVAIVDQNMDVLFFTPSEIDRARARALLNRNDIEPVEVNYEIVEK